MRDMICEHAHGFDIIVDGVRTGTWETGGAARAAIAVERRRIYAWIQHNATAHMYVSLWRTHGLGHATYTPRIAAQLQHALANAIGWASR